jgi:VIT1/CCC1 family predicted Fe2+/Mn2+ transporter
VADPSSSVQHASSSEAPTVPADRAWLRASFRDEVDGAFLYGTLAELEAAPRIADVYRRLAAEEQSHAERWEAGLRALGEVPSRTPSRRARVLAWLARRLGPTAVLQAVIGSEVGAVKGYRQAGAGDEITAQERKHSRVLRALGGAGGGLEGGTLARLEGRHRAVGGNALRAAVLGANDGLVSNLSLVMGVAGASLSGRAILVTGLAGLIAGAGSMAMGEWLSVQSSRELSQRQIAVEAEEIARVPQEEAEELALIYQAKGLPEDQARALAQRLISDDASALDTLAREELGIDPKELGGSAIEAAVTSFLLFAVGAIIPVSPFLFLSASGAVAASIGLSAAALFLIGAGITLLTGRGVLASGLRQLGIGMAAAGLTYGVGRMIGAALTG